MANTLSIQALPSFRCLWLFAMSMLSFSPTCWLRSWAYQDMVWLVTLRLLMNAPKASWMTCAIQGIWFLNAGHTMWKATRVDCSSWVIEKFEEALSVVFASKWPSVSSKWSCTSFNWMASLAPVCWHLTYHPKVAFQIGKALAINLIQSELYFS